MAAIQRIDLCPRAVNVCAYAGDDASLRVVVTVPGALAGATWSAQLRQKRTGPVVADFDVEMESEDVAILTLTDMQTTELAGFVGVWDVQVDNGKARTLVQGEFTVNYDVTRPGS